MVGAFAALLVPAASSAQGTFGLRLGYALAGGETVEGEKLADTVASQVPFQLDFLYRFKPEIAAGIYGSIGFGQLDADVKLACDSVVTSCSANVLRAGVQATYTFKGVSPIFVPWLGVGAGVERLSRTIVWVFVPETVETVGFEFLLELGGDVAASPEFSVGPYLQLSFGQYRSQDGNGIVNKATHEWYGLGLRAKYDL